jgi:hypothetical protein
VEGETALVRADQTGRWVLGIAGLGGLAIFTFFFALTWSTPQWVESFAADFIQHEIKERIGSRIDRLRPPAGGSALAIGAAEFLRRNQETIDEIKAQLRSGINEQLAAAIAEVRDPNCGCRQTLQSWLDAGASTRLWQLLNDKDRILSFIHATYMEVVTDLKREIRIFTATNAAAFLLLVLISFAKPAATRHLLFPGMLLLIATLMCAYLYVSSQDWLLTIIHGSYVGWAYAAYLGVVFLFLVDIAMNRGQVTTRVVNGISGALGGVASSLSPC